METWLRRLTTGPHCLSLLTYRPDWIDQYVVFSILPILGLAIATGYGGTLGVTLSVLAFIVATYRLIEIFARQLGILFVDSRRPEYFIQSVQ